MPEIEFRDLCAWLSEHEGQTVRIQVGYGGDGNLLNMSRGLAKVADLQSSVTVILDGDGEDMLFFYQDEITRINERVGTIKVRFQGCSIELMPRNLPAALD